MSKTKATLIYCFNKNKFNVVYKKSLEISIPFFFKNYGIRGFPVRFMKDETRIFKMIAKVMQVSNVSPSPYWGWAQAYN